MIELFSGTPGSGKSFHATQKMYYLLRSRKNVICNYDISLDACRKNFFQFWLSKILRIDCKGSKKIGRFEYLNNQELTVSYLKEYARKYHNRRKEGQTTVFIDECGIMFNPRTFAQKDRIEWIEFFSLHRHYGFDFVLISQSDRMLDRQIRAFVEYEHKHRKANNFGIGGVILGLLCMGSVFVDVKLWYGLREKVGSQWIRYSPRIASLYDTMYLEDEDSAAEEEAGASSKVGDEERGGTPADDDALLPSHDGKISICTLPFTDFEDELPLV